MIFTSCFNSFSRGSFALDKDCFLGLETLELFLLAEGLCDGENIQNSILISHLISKMREFTIATSITRYPFLVVCLVHGVLLKRLVHPIAGEPRSIRLLYLWTSCSNHGYCWTWLGNCQRHQQTTRCLHRCRHFLITDRPSSDLRSRQSKQREK